MALTVLTGGARSGKSELAVKAAAASGLAVTVIATAEARDPEFAARIQRHRAARPPGWTVVEEPIELREAIGRAAGDSFLIVDCISLWAANLLEQGLTEDELLAAARAAAAAAAERSAQSLAVTNEVGWGIVPGNPLARHYRDVLGRANRAWVEASAEAWLVVAGRALRLEEWQAA
jgi:adenosylcobinamide kinase/adenosylcobinamide-phosphate guanylyltransferase